MATAKKLPSGSWRCQVFSHYETVILPDGSTKKKRIYKSFTSDDPTRAGKREAELAAAQFSANKRTSTNSTTITFGNALDDYIEKRSEVLSPRTIMDYKRIRRKDIQSLMNIKICDLTQEDIQNAINEDAKMHSPKTVRNNHGLISAVLKQYRPDFALNTALPKKVRPDLYIPSDADIQRLLTYVKDTELELPVLLAAFGPMRRGEICALHSKNINGNIVHVCENMVIQEDGTWIIKSPKSYAGDRYIEYPDFVTEKLKGLEGRVVRLSPDVITNRFERVLKRAGIHHFRFHDLRHYAASILHALGIPDAYIMLRGGWSSDGVLKNVYRHALSDKIKEMDDKANEHFSKLCNTKCNTKQKKH